MKKNRKKSAAPPPDAAPETEPLIEQTKKQPFLKRLLFGEETPDLSELEAGSTTILDILSPTSVDTKSRDYTVVDGVFAMQKHRKTEMCHFLAPTGQPEMMHKNFMQRHLRLFVVQCSCMKFYAYLYITGYKEILSELDAGPENHHIRLQTYREVYDRLTLPLFLLPCNEAGCLQLRILGIPNYRELLAKIILKSKYVPPPENRPMYDALYQGAPFVMAADMDLRRIDAALDAARSDGNSQIALAALPEQVESVLNRRYRETGKARVFTITDAALRELLGSTAPYTPPDLPFYTSEGSVLDVPPLKAP